MKFPHLMDEWHPTKNLNLIPENLTHGSKRKIWWQCKEGHEWKATPNGRTSRGNGCPYCAGKLLISGSGKSLAEKFPKIASEWHATKNGEKTPKDFFSRSNKSIWWICFEGHEWKASIASRTGRMSKCPYCSGRKPSKTNNFQFKFPHIADEWHPTKNLNFRPHEITYGSGKKVWWQCKNGHELRAPVSRRSAGDNCPYCSNRRVSAENNLLITFPKISKEWHPKKNGNKLPENYTFGSNQKVWWKCAKGHEWQATIANRTGRKSKCPFCNANTSLPEIRIYCEMKTLFDGVIWTSKISGREIDVFVDDLNLAIEYDGYFFHKDKVKNDKNKNKSLKKRNIKVLRIREKPLKKIEKWDIICPQGELKKITFDKILTTVLDNFELEANRKSKLEKYICSKQFLNVTDFNRIKASLPNAPFEKSLAFRYPSIAQMWDKAKNKLQNPQQIFPYTKQKFWWRCSHGHFWEYQVDHAVKYGCPYCNKKRVSKDYNFEKLFPDMAKEWNYERNGELRPNEITHGGKTKVWWRCSEGHEWESSLNHRTSSLKPCPKCSAQ